MYIVEEVQKQNNKLKRQVTTDYIYNILLLTFFHDPQLHIYNSKLIVKYNPEND